MAEDIYLGEFEVGGNTYTVTEDDYLQVPEELFNKGSIDEIINAAKHICLQRNGKIGNLAENVSTLRGDYHFSHDPIDFDGTVLVFDANNLAHRVRHTFHLSYKQFDVSVLYGFLSVMSATIRRFKNVKTVVVCWDGGVPQYRYDRTPSYKNHTHGDDEGYQEFLMQIKELQAILPSFGIYSLRKNKAEADDLIYHTTRLIHPDSLKIVISTDQDLLQCINGNTHVWQPSKEVLIDRAGFKAYTGLAQSEFLVYRCMVGDGSDGIDGCKGIGEKTALKLIEDYGASPSNIINIATGTSPTNKPMSTSVAEKLRLFGLKGFQDTMVTIRLDRDLCGVRGYLLNAFKQELSYDSDAVSTFLKKWAFVSFMDVEFYKLFKNLDRPRLSYLPGDELRFPRVVAERKPVLKPSSNQD